MEPNPRSGAAGPARAGHPDFNLVVKRNCSMSPHAVLYVVLLTAVVCFSIGALFAWRGLWLVMPFSGLEVVAIAAAFYVSGRHASDYERFWLEAGWLMVEVRDGARLSRHRFQMPWARVLLHEGARDVRLALAAAGKELTVGRLLPPEQRVLLAGELRRALRAAGGMG